MKYSSRAIHCKGLNPSLFEQVGQVLLAAGGLEHGGVEVGKGRFRQLETNQCYQIFLLSVKLCILGDGASQEGNVCAQDALHQDRDIL